jgi:hypothetical protein
MIINMNMGSFVIEEISESNYLYKDDIQWAYCVPELGLNFQQQKSAITANLATMDIDELLFKMDASKQT